MADFINIYLINYHSSRPSNIITKAFLTTVKAISCFAHTSRSLRPSLKLIIELIMPNQSQHRSLLNYPPHPFLHAHPKKLISPLATTSGCISILMRLMSSSNCHRKALPWILFTGGQADVHNSQIYLDWHGIYSPSQVCFNCIPPNTILIFPKAQL